MRFGANLSTGSSCVLQAITLAVFAIGLSGCALGPGNAIDDLTTASITQAGPTASIVPQTMGPHLPGPDHDRLLDEDTMRLAATTADIATVPADGIPWANASTGTTGRITQIAQSRVDGEICRVFSATRQAYDGVSLYNGEVCLDRSNRWWTKSLAPVQ